MTTPQQTTNKPTFEQIAQMYHSVKPYKLWSLFHMYLSDLGYDEKERNEICIKCYKLASK